MKVKVEKKPIKKGMANGLNILEPILDKGCDSLLDLEGFLTKIVEAAAIIVNAQRSKIVLFKEDEEGRVSEDFDSTSLGNEEDLINVPLILRGLERPIGYIEVRGRKDARPFDSRDAISVMMMGRQAMLKIESDLFYHNIYETMLEMLNSLVYIIESRDPYLHSHSSRVSSYALGIAKAIGMADEEVSKIHIASLLHDIGKIGIPDYILAKRGHLTKQENMIIQTHSVIGENIIKPLGFLLEEKKIVRHHHEYFDGSGYPDGLKADEIPINDRILTVADTFDAMTSDRPYRCAKSVKESVDEIDKLKGIKYDPLVVTLFKSYLEKNPVPNSG